MWPIGTKPDRMRRKDYSSLLDAQLERIGIGGLEVKRAKVEAAKGQFTAGPASNLAMGKDIVPRLRALLWDPFRSLKSKATSDLLMLVAFAPTVRFSCRVNKLASGLHVVFGSA